MKWISRLWRGEIGLGRAFWLFGVLIPIALAIATKFFTTLALAFMLFAGFSGPSAPGLLKGALLFTVAIVVLQISYQVLACVGVWRSARHFPGNPLYSILARGTLALYLTVTSAGVGVVVYIWLMNP